MAMVHEAVPAVQKPLARAYRCVSRRRKADAKWENCVHSHSLCRKSVTHRKVKIFVLSSTEYLCEDCVCDDCQYVKVFQSDE